MRYSAKPVIFLFESQRGIQNSPCVPYAEILQGCNAVPDQAGPSLYFITNETLSMLALYKSANAGYET